MSFGPKSLTKSIFGFDPRSIGQCTLWLDAADFNSFTMTPGTSNITAWRDKSVNSASFTGVNDPFYNVNTFNGNSAILLDSTMASKAYFTGPLKNTNNVVTVFCVAALYNWSSSDTMYGRLISTASAGNIYDYNAGNMLIARDGNNLAIFATTSSGNATPTYPANFPTVGSSIPFLYSLHCIGSIGYTYFNGSIALAPAASGSAYNYETLDIGRIQGGGIDGYWDGYLCEFLVYNTVLSDQQRQQVEGYLAWKWGLQAQLPTNHPYYSYKIAARNFIPTDMDNCVGWFDAADTSTVGLSGTSVVIWRDKSGQGYNATAPTSMYPDYTTDSEGRRCIQFDGTSQFLECNTAVMTHNHCLIGVWAPDNTNGYFQGNTSLFRFQKDPGGGYYIVFPYQFYTDNKGYITDFDTAAINYANSTLIENSVASNANICIANIGQVYQAIYKNGFLQNYTNQSITNVTESSIMTIGAFYLPPSSGEYFQGKVYELIVYNTQLNNSQRQVIEGYLAWKWGLRASLHSENSYMSYPPPSPYPFLPTNIPDCVLWLDGADPGSMQFNSGTFEIVTWKDKSGQGNDATATGTPIFTPGLINGQAAVRLDNGPYFIGNMNITYQTVTCFAVATTDIVNTTPDQRLVSLGTSSNYDYDNALRVIALFVQGNTDTIQSWRDYATQTSNLVTPQTPFLVTSQYDGQYAYMYYNGSNAQLTGSSSGGQFGISQYGIGNAANVTAEYWRGNIGEIILYFTSLSPYERQTVEGYLAKKWNIPLANTAPFYRAFPGSMPPTTYMDVSSGLILDLDCSLYVANDTYLLPIYGNTWTVVDSPTPTSTLGGSRALALDGVSQMCYDNIGIPNPEQYWGEVWFNAASLQDATILGEMGQPGPPDYTGYHWGVVRITSAGEIFVGPYTTSIYAGIYEPNKWYHIAFVNYGGPSDTFYFTTVVVYLNGEYVNDRGYTRYAPFNSYYCLGGPANPNNAFFYGQVGYFRFYSVAPNFDYIIKQSYNRLCERYGRSILP